MTGVLPAPALGEGCAEAGVIADDADVALREDVAAPGGNGDMLAIEFCAGCTETAAHILPDPSQISDRGAVADNCCFSGRDSGVAPGDGDVATADAELAGARPPAEEAEARSYIVEAGYSVLDGSLPERPAYRKAMNTGRSVTETSFRTLNEAAACFIQALIDRIGDGNGRCDAAQAASHQRPGDKT